MFLIQAIRGDECSLACHFFLSLLFPDTFSVGFQLSKCFPETSLAPIKNTQDTWSLIGYNFRPTHTLITFPKIILDSVSLHALV